MTWPFEKKEEIVNPEVNDSKKEEVKAPEKSPAELIAEALNPFKDALNARLDAIENSVKRPEPKPTQVGQPEFTSFLDDENVAFAQRATPLMLRQLELEARIVKNDIKAEYERAGYGDLWAQFEKEINDVLEGSPLATGDGRPQRGNPDYVRNVVDMVFGRNARKAGMRFDGKAKGFFLETGASGEGRPQEPQNDGLTDGQRKVFSRMRVSTDDAKKVLAKLKFV